MNTKALLAEFIGTFCLAFAVMSSMNDFPVVTPFIAALCLGMFVYTIGGISGCHINPAVTIGLMSIGKIAVPDGVGYIVAQIAGACAAGALILANGNAAHVLDLGNPDLVKVIIAEALGMFFFTFGISAVVHEKVADSMSGIVVAGSLLLGIVVAAYVSKGVLNPAVSIGISGFTFSPAYLVGPIVGSVLGFMVGKTLHNDW